MRKNYALLKRYVLALTFLLTTAIIIYSCKKDRNIETPIQEVEELKQLFESVQATNVISNLFASLKPKMGNNLRN